MDPEKESPSGGLRLLVVDGDRISRLTAVRHLERLGYSADAVEDALGAMARLQDGPWDVLLLDLDLPDEEGLALLGQIKARFPDVQVILMTAFGSIETAVAAIKQGAADYLPKPFRFHELDLRLRRLKELHDTRSELQDLRAILGQGESRFGMVGASAAMATVFARIPIFAGKTAPVLVTGETGTGKELVARALHREGPRRQGPFVAVSCGSIPRDLAESELFGHEKGSFTGAAQRRKGSFETAHGGTILLDDLDDLPLELQVKLLRVLQEGTIRRVGGSAEIPIDVRVVATTKVLLGEAVKAGRFRDDLFYRLCGLEIHLPPLRERGDDYLLLARHFLALFANRDGAAPRRLSLETAELLGRYPWPGNVRELRGAMETATVLCQEAEIWPEHLPRHFQGVDRTGKETLFTLNLEGAERVSFTDLVARFERDLIQWALLQAGGQQTRAAEFLCLPRTTFQSKLGRNQ